MSDTLARSEPSSQDTTRPPTITRRSQSLVLYRTEANAHPAIIVSGPTSPVRAASGEMPPEEPRYAGWPLGFLRQYAEAASRHSTVRETDEGVWIAFVVDLDGAWSEGSSAEEAAKALPETIVDWLIVKLRLGATDIPQIDGLSLKPL